MLMDKTGLDMITKMSFVFNSFLSYFLVNCTPQKNNKKNIFFPLFEVCLHHFLPPWPLLQPVKFLDCLCISKWILNAHTKEKNYSEFSQSTRLGPMLHKYAFVLKVFNITVTNDNILDDGEQFP